MDGQKKEGKTTRNILIGAGILAVLLAFKGKEVSATTTECGESETKTRLCRDGTRITTDECVDGFFQPTGETCPQLTCRMTLESNTRSLIEISGIVILENPLLLVPVHVQIDWSDGSTVEDINGKTFETRHAYGAPGFFNIRMTAWLNDDPTRSCSTSLPIFIPA